ncbi:hypothetical protein GmHk_19G054125 [Glycine max]|nr:hypothetical protein GmHk_19G054125 [Glycine max]
MVFNNQLFIPKKVMDETLFHTWSWLSVSHCLCYMLYTSVHLVLTLNYSINYLLLRYFFLFYFLQKTKRGTINNLKVVHSGTKEFKIASNKRDLFLGFSEHQERLRKKLALEEGRIFAANEQLS